MQQLQELQKQAESLRRKPDSDYVNRDPQADLEARRCGLYELSVIGSENGYDAKRDTRKVGKVTVIGSRKARQANVSQQKTAFQKKAKSNRLKPVMKREKAPLRRILRKFPEGFSVREELECGHWHTDNILTREHDQKPAKRRRCHECRDGRPVETILTTVKHTSQINLWSIESGTAQVRSGAQPLPVSRSFSRKRTEVH